MQPIYLTLSEKEILATALTQFIVAMEKIQEVSKRAADDQRVARDLRARLINTSHGDF